MSQTVPTKKNKGKGKEKEKKKKIKERPTFAISYGEVVLYRDSVGPTLNNVITALRVSIGVPAGTIVLSHRLAGNADARAEIEKRLLEMNKESDIGSLRDADTDPYKCVTLEESLKIVQEKMATSGVDFMAIYNAMERLINVYDRNDTIVAQTLTRTKLPPIANATSKDDPAVKEYMDILCGTDDQRTLKLIQEERTTGAIAENVLVETPQTLAFLILCLQYYIRSRFYSIPKSVREYHQLIIEEEKTLVPAYRQLHDHLRRRLLQPKESDVAANNNREEITDIHSSDFKKLIADRPEECQMLAVCNDLLKRIMASQSRQKANVETCREGVGEIVAARTVQRVLMNIFCPLLQKTAADIDAIIGTDETLAPLYQIVRGKDPPYTTDGPTLTFEFIGSQLQKQAISFCKHLEDNQKKMVEKRKLIQQAYAPPTNQPDEKKEGQPDSLSSSSSSISPPLPPPSVSDQNLSE